MLWMTGMANTPGDPGHQHLIDQGHGMSMKCSLCVGLLAFEAQQDLLCNTIRCPRL